MFLLSYSVSINVSVSSSVVSSFSSPCLLCLRPQHRSSLPVSLAEVLDESDPQFFADGGILGHLPQRVPVYSPCELDDDQPTMWLMFGVHGGEIFISKLATISRVFSPSFSFIPRILRFQLRLYLSISKTLSINSELSFLITDISRFVVCS